MLRPRPPVRRQTYFLVYSLIALCMLLAHWPLLKLPFYWDETGQFIPAALDLYHSGAAIPHSTVPNVHPPGVMAYLAVFWHLFGYSIAGTRVAMLLVASLGALFAFLLGIELARGAPGAPAFTALALLLISPLFFAQSMLAQLDVPAMSFSLLALLLFLQDRYRACALTCVALVLTKETGLAAAVLFGFWLVWEKKAREALWFLMPVAALSIWLVALKIVTGHWLGNAEFAQYNVFYPLHPVRLGFALIRRLYYLFIGCGHIIGTAALLWALGRMPLLTYTRKTDRHRATAAKRSFGWLWRGTAPFALLKNRAWRISAAFVAVNVVVVSVLGGAVLERYLLPVLPIVYIAFAVSLRAQQPKYRSWVLFALMMCLFVANFVNPPYPFPFENNLSFVGFVGMEQQVAEAIDTRPGRIATTFPLSNALRHPEYGYVALPRDVVELKSFRLSDITHLRGGRPDMMVVYDTTWDPLHLLQKGPSRWLMKNYFNYEEPLTPEEIAGLLSLRIARSWESRGLKMTLLVRDSYPGLRL